MKFGRTRIALAVAIAGVLSVGLAACGSSPSDTPGGSGDKPFSGQTLLVACWQDYGCDDTAVQAAFEEKTGAKVETVFFTSEDGLLQMLRQGGVGKIDVALPNLQYIGLGAEQGLFQPLDKSQIATWDDIAPQFRDLPSLSSNGELYAVPWTTGSTSLAINPDKVKPVPDSWSVLWDPSSKGKVAFYDDPTTAIMTAALYLGEDPQDPDLGKVKKALLDLKKNTVVNWASGDEWDKAFIAESITMGNLWGGHALYLQDQGVKLSYVFPKEGAIGWIDAWTMVKDAPHPELAYEWINFMTGPASTTAWVGHNDPVNTPALPTNVAAFNGLTEEQRTRHFGTVDYPSYAVAMQAGIPNDRLAAWTDVWQEVKAG